MTEEQAKVMSAGDALAYGWCWRCGTELEDGVLCEYDVNHETGDTEYCGWLRCPSCGNCQGQRLREAAEDIPHGVIQP